MSLLSGAARPSLFPADDPHLACTIRPKMSEGCASGGGFAQRDPDCAT